MAQVDKNIYPDVSTNTYCTTTLTTSGSNFQTYLQTGLERSITYTMSTYPYAPFRNAYSCDMASEDTWTFWYNYSSGTAQRIALVDAAAQDYGSDVCSIQQMQNHPWSTFTSNNHLYSAFKWNGISGRILCYFYTSPNGTTVDYTNLYLATWKDFKDLINANPSTNYILVSVFAEIKGGDPAGNRGRSIKGTSLYKYSTRWWNFYENKEATTDDIFQYACLRPMTWFFGQNVHKVNNVGSFMSNSADRCWPIYNWGYGNSAYGSPNAFAGRGGTGQQVNGKLVFGVDPNISDQRFTIDAGSYGRSKTYGISVLDFGRANLIEYIEKKAATLGVILFQDQKEEPSNSNPGTAATSFDNFDMSTIQDVFSHTDIFVPITDENGYFNGDFLVYGDDPTGTSAEAMIQGDKDYPFDYGAGTVDPSPVGDTGVTFFALVQELNAFAVDFGVGVTSSDAPLHEPDSSSDPDPDIIKYYDAGSYIPTVRFTSPKTQQEYIIPLNKLSNLNYRTPYYALVNTGTDITRMVGDYNERNRYFDKNDDTAYIRGVRCPIGRYQYSDMVSLPYSGMEDATSTSTFTLAAIVDYMSKTVATFDSEDVFTEINIDFADIHNPTTVIDTETVDFSSLAGLGIDVHDGDSTGGGGGGSIWNGGGNDPSNQGSDKTPAINTPSNSPYNIFNRTYILDEQNVRNLSDLVTTTDSSVIDAILDGLQMFGANPINAIVDLRMYPFDVAVATGSYGGATGITLGHYNASNVQGILMADRPMCSISLGAYQIKHQYYSFLDYEPYTQIRLYIPYVGTVDLPPSIYMGHLVGVNLIIDYITGACRAVIYRDNDPMMFQDGVIGVSIPVTGDNAAQYSNSIIGNLVGAIGSAAGAVANLSTGKVGDAVKDAGSAIGDLFDMGSSINDVKFQQAGTASPSISSWMPQSCYVTIARPVEYLTQSEKYAYGEIVGYATAYGTNMSGIKNSPGIFYAVMSELIQIGSTLRPTDKEIEMIKSILNSGFFTVQS